jgi:hypothetical protein
LRHSISLFCDGFFPDRVSLTVLHGLPSS